MSMKNFFARLRSVLRDRGPVYVAARVMSTVLTLLRTRWFNLRRAMADPLRLAVVRGQRIRVGVASEMERFRVASYESKEPETLDWIDQNFHAGDVFFDIGANIGVYSLYAGRRTASGSVYAFEPEAQNFSRLCRNVAANGLTNVVPSCIALADRCRFDYFYVGSMEVGSAMHSLGAPSAFRREVAPLRQGAFAIALDEFVATVGAPRPTILKIDVDGIEVSILEGARQTLQSGSIRTLLVELNTTEEGLIAIKAMLSSWGYELRSESQWSSRSGDLQSRNYIFSRIEI